MAEKSKKSIYRIYYYRYMLISDSKYIGGTFYMKKYVFAGFMAAVLTVGSSPLTAWGIKKNNKAPAQNTAKNVSKTVTWEKSPISPDGTLKEVKDPSWSQNKDTPVTLNWFFAYDWYPKVWNPDKNFADKKLLTDTGITLNITTGDMEKLNTLVATGNMPDIITFDAVNSLRKQLENNKQLLPLDTLAAQYAPDLIAVKSMQDWYRNEDGHWYSYASFFYGPEHTNADFGGSYTTHNCNFVRTDLLKKIGMTMSDMNTKEGFLKSLKTVKEKKITYNGLSVIPYTGVGADYLAQQFGVDIEDKKGNLINIKRTPEFLEALQYYNEMYRSKLFTDEEFTMNKTQRDAKVSSGAVFAATGWMNVDSARKVLYGNDPDAKIAYCGRIMGGDNGKKPIILAQGTAGWSGAMITKKCKHPDRAIQLFAYLSQERQILDNYYGVDCYQVIGRKVVQNADKLKEFTENPQQFDNKYKINMGWMVDWCVWQRYRQTTSSWEQQNQYDMEDDRTVELCVDFPFTDVNPEGGTELASVNSRIDAYWQQAVPKIIMADSEAECRQQYIKAITEMDKLGMKDLDNYKNQRFQKNKKRMGITYAWPRNK
jgi:putative aldouronate transport system substrate-binding protein